MNFRAPFIALALVATASAQVPKIFSGLFEKDVPVKGQIGVVLPPQEIDKYVAKVEAAARKDPKWFREFSAQAKPGSPLPYDERLGLTNEEYNAYLKLWSQRAFKPMEDVQLMLREPTPGNWSLTSTGGASNLSTLRYTAKDDLFRSPNGEMKRLPDIQADASSILGEWSGAEWKFEESSEFGKTKENIAIGRFSDNKYGLIVYRMQEISSEGSRLLDKSLVIRFPLGKATPAPAPKKAKP
ncbi:MAG: hypothetical protein QM680_04750 [Luteolibacter sp.]